jgi:hypothetical protein
MSRGKWSPLAKPHGYTERAELAARIEDATAQLHTTQQALGVISQLVRQLELGRDKGKAA